MAVAPALLLLLQLLSLPPLAAHAAATPRRTVVCHSGPAWASAEASDLFNLPSDQGSIAFLDTRSVFPTRPFNIFWTP
eukprot:1179803-Prorocentrum_minimum.AAC.2